MEETRYCMWARSKLGETTPQVVQLQTRSSHVHFPAAKTAEPSWEERAFAEDSAGLLHGGCVWPPRSYSCNFCRREFRSAQALGGHMNVHRRDRARLKQSSPPSPQHQALGGHPSFVSSSSLPLLSPTSRVTSAATIQSGRNDCIKQGLILPPYSRPTVNPASNHRKGPSDSLASRLVIISDSNPEEENDLNNQGKETGLKVKQGEYYELNPSSMKTFGLVPNRSWPTGSAEDEEVGRDSVSRKRRRNEVDDTSYLPFFLKPILDDRRHRLESNELLGLHLNRSCSKEELDLELRL